MTFNLYQFIVFGIVCFSGGVFAVGCVMNAFIWYVEKKDVREIREAKKLHSVRSAAFDLVDRVDDVGQ